MTSDRAVLSVDFEFFTHTPAYRSAVGTVSRDDIGGEGIEFLLDALDEHGATATVFTVGEIAETHPGLVERIADAGHEVGSHTQTHALLSALDEEDHRSEFEESRRALADVTGQSVSGFRAPAFDLPPDHFDRLRAAGYAYDSSVVPARSIPGWYGGEHHITRPCAANQVDPDAPPDVMELPVSVMPGLRLPLTGAWLRFFGTRYTTAGMKLLARRGITPVLYLHPWELVDLPAVDGVPTRVYWRTGEWTRRAVETILSTPFEFVTARSEVDRAA